MRIYIIKGIPAYSHLYYLIWLLVLHWKRGLVMDKCILITHNCVLNKRQSYSFSRDPSSRRAGLHVQWPPSDVYLRVWKVAQCVYLWFDSRFCHLSQVLALCIRQALRLSVTPTDYRHISREDNLINLAGPSFSCVVSCHGRHSAQY